MKYERVVKGTFLSRPNRFIAQVEIDGAETTVHVKNTGRCAELLLPHRTVWLAKAENDHLRKTVYDLVAVEKIVGSESIIVNLDSQAPNAVAYEWLSRGTSGNNGLRREVRYKSSRFDLFDEKTDTYIEVKGVTLERDGGAYFPDAPTERGVKHLSELADCVRAGHGARLIFVVQMKGVSFVSPNEITHPAFGEALRYASSCGVEISAVDCVVTPDSITADKELPVRL